MAPLVKNPPRTAWDGFPDVLIHAAETTVKQHPQYKAAKSGDGDAAVDLVLNTVSIDKILALEQLASRSSDQSPPPITLPARAAASKGASAPLKYESRLA